MAAKDRFYCSCPLVLTYTEEAAYCLFFLFPGMFSKPFGSSDPRLKVALTEHEPLIHFALVCGAKSCPPIKTYSADVSIHT